MTDPRPYERGRTLPATKAGVATIEISELVTGGLLVRVHASEPALAFVDGLLDMKRLTPAQSAALACAVTLNKAETTIVVVQ